MAGAVGFVGVIVPHVARLFVGPAHLRTSAASALAGSAFLIVCDLVARTVHPAEEIRLGNSYGHHGRAAVLLFVGAPIPPIELRSLLHRDD